MLIDEILKQVIETRDSAFFYTPPIYQNSNSYLFKNPARILTSSNADDTLDTLSKIDNEINTGNQGYGIINYEAGYALEKKLNAYLDYNNEPLLKFCFFNKEEIISLASKELNIEYLDEDKRGISSLDLTNPMTEFINKIAEIKEQISCGNTYQVNYTIKAKFDLLDDPVMLFKRLIFNQSSKYCAFINNCNDLIISISPELFFSIKNDLITVRPMKGTIKRGFNLNDDLLQKSKLENSEKDKAENSMIVDLMRNDIGKLSEYDAVEVNKVFEIEKYETLYQMVSEIRARLKNGIKFSDVIRNIFPCGSITGAPKIMTMQIIHDLEYVKRGIYTGAIGLIKSDEIIFNVAIRTLKIIRNSNTGELGIGSGIVWDSNPEKEFEETILKSKFLSNTDPYFELLETVRIENNQAFLLDQHLKRLQDSADYFLFLFELEKLKVEIQKIINDLDPDEKYILRIRLNKTGLIKMEIKDFSKVPEEINIIVSKNKINSMNRFQYFKTTNRNLYNNEFVYYSTRNYYDVIFFNEKDELAEGAISNIFIKKGGLWYTPNLSSGILPGIYREYFISQNKNVTEKIISRTDLNEAEEIMLTNSVRGEIKVNKLFLDESYSPNLSI